MKPRGSEGEILKSLFLILLPGWPHFLRSLSLPQTRERLSPRFAVGRSHSSDNTRVILWFSYGRWGNSPAHRCMTHGRDRKTIHIEAATKRKENGIVTAAVWRSFVGESAPIGRDDGDDGQDQADGRQSLSQSGHSQIALLHLLILPCDGPTHTRTFLALTLFLFVFF